MWNLAFPIWLSNQQSSAIPSCEMTLGHPKIVYLRPSGCLSIPKQGKQTRTLAPQQHPRKEKNTFLLENISSLKNPRKNTKSIPKSSNSLADINKSGPRNARSFFRFFATAPLAAFSGQLLPPPDCAAQPAEERWTLGVRVGPGFGFSFLRAVLDKGEKTCKDMLYRNTTVYRFSFFWRCFER